MPSIDGSIMLYSGVWLLDLSFHLLSLHLPIVCIHSIIHDDDIPRVFEQIGLFTFSSIVKGQELSIIAKVSERERRRRGGREEVRESMQQQLQLLLLLLPLVTTLPKLAGCL